MHMEAKKKALEFQFIPEAASSQMCIEKLIIGKMCGSWHNECDHMISSLNESHELWEVFEGKKDSLCMWNRKT